MEEKKDFSRNKIKKEPKIISNFSSYHKIKKNNSYNENNNNNNKNQQKINSNIIFNNLNNTNINKINYKINKNNNQIHKNIKFNKIELLPGDNGINNFEESI